MIRSDLAYDYVPPKAPDRVVCDQCGRSTRTFREAPETETGFRCEPACCDVCVRRTASTSRPSVSAPSVRLDVCGLCADTLDELMNEAARRGAA